MTKASETAERKETIYTQKIGMNLLIKKSTASGEEVSAGIKRDLGHFQIGFVHITVAGIGFNLQCRRIIVGNALQIDDGRGGGDDTATAPAKAISQAGATRAGALFLLQFA